MIFFKGVEVELKDGKLSLTALTHIPFFRAPTEQYDLLSGKLSIYNRRDMRKGQFSGYIKAREDGGINFFYRGGEPFSGHCCDEIVLEDGGSSLIITTTLTLERGDSCVYRVVYRRANMPASPPSSHLLKRIEMMKNATQAHLRMHPPHSPHHLHVKTHRAPHHQHAQPKERDSSRSLASQTGSQNFSRKGTPDFDNNNTPDNLAIERHKTSYHLLASGDRRGSSQHDASTSLDTSSPFHHTDGSRQAGQLRNSIDSASDAFHTANASNKGRKEKTGRGKRWGDDLRRSSATFSEFLRL